VAIGSYHRWGWQRQEKPSENCTRQRREAERIEHHDRMEAEEDAGGWGMCMGGMKMSGRLLCAETAMVLMRIINSGFDYRIL